MSNDEQSSRTSRLSRVTKPGILLLLAVMLFWAGVAVGRGSWHLNKLDPLANNRNLPPNLNYAAVEQLYDLLKKDFDGQLKQDKLLDGAKDGLVKATGDPYTDYLNPQEAKEFDEALSGSFSGIGAELGAGDDGEIKVIAPLAGSPAEQAGLKAQDVISAIDDDSTQDMSIEEAVRKIRGPAGSKVKLTIIRDSQPPVELSITRKQITIASVESQMDGQIGYLKISQFNGDTIEQAQQAQRDLKAKDAKALVLDLRGNPGGFLEAAVSVASLWLEKGKTVMSERRGSQTLKVFRASGNNPLKGLPTVVLINEGSASASEIVAGALSDHKIATLVGLTTFGKGSIQLVEDLPGGAELKVTVARWYTPAGKNIDKQGIKPDLEVKLTEDEQKAGKDSQKDKALEILRAKISST